LHSKTVGVLRLLVEFRKIPAHLFLEILGWVIQAPERLVKRIALDPKVITQESEAAA